MTTDPDEWLFVIQTLLSVTGTVAFYVVVFIVLLLLSAVFSAAETAFSSINIIRVRQQSRGNRKNAKAAKKVLLLNKNFSQFLSTILVSNNLVNMAASSLMTYLFTINLNLGESGVLIATIVVSVLVIIFGEIIPKNLAKVYPEKIAYAMARPIYVLTKILIPITAGFKVMNKRIVEKAEEDDERVTATEDELVEIVETIEKEGVLEQIESEIIQSAIHFDDKTIRKVMISREHVTYVHDDISFLELLNIVKNSPYSRIPVLSKTTEKVLGIIRQRDLFDRIVTNHGVLEGDIRTLIRPSLIVSHRRLLPYALEKMQRQKNHMLIVVDNVREKNFLGILTLEDVLEEIVGEIYDEGDKLPNDVVEIGLHIFEVKGTVMIEDFFDRFLDDTTFPRTTALTMGAWVKRLARSKLKEGKKVKYDNLVMTITHCSETEIHTIEVEQQTKMDEEDD